VGVALRVKNRIQDKVLTSVVFKLDPCIVNIFETFSQYDTKHLLVINDTDMNQSC